MYPGIVRLVSFTYKTLCLLKTNEVRSQRHNSPECIVDKTAIKLYNIGVEVSDLGANAGAIMAVVASRFIKEFWPVMAAAAGSSLLSTVGILLREAGGAFFYSRAGIVYLMSVALALTG